MTDYSNLSDNTLIDLLRTGDRAAYTAIYNRYNRMLYNFAFKRLGDREEIKDLLHEIFLSLWSKHENLNIDHTLTTYLFSCVRNKIVDIIIRKKLSEKYIDSFKKFQESGQNTTDHYTRHQQLAGYIKTEIEALPPKMREVFELSRKNNFTRKQIAEKLNLPEQTVKSRMRHALKILREKFGNS